VETTGASTVLPGEGATSSEVDTAETATVTGTTHEGWDVKLETTRTSTAIRAVEATTTGRAHEGWGVEVETTGASAGGGDDGMWVWMWRWIKAAAGQQ
jgi:hypothetical protein